ncbi:unnamed protein product [Brachionus calyciflorus]|uniref:C2H2-type domain-containing protein n=1 Tax=Brachionus calyciflorus TaxID=104777 RepID=A0A813MAU0_9BILA|nr:unnamed protein product [Brachionus calyciflorus]
MSLNELIYQNFVQNMSQMKQDEEHEVSESTTTNETSSSNLQSDVSVVESESDETRQEKNNSSDEEDDEPKQELPTINQLYQQNYANAQMMQLINSQKQEKAIEHEKENSPICKYCNKIFANVSNLNHHINAIHLNQSKWTCSQCGKICSSKSNLKVHLRVHLRVKPYHCRWCSYSCMHHSSIRDHLAKVHPDKTHTPLQPGYLFNSQAVPEPEVFNSQGFNANSFSAESKSKRSSTEINENGPQSPEKSRTSKKMRMDKSVKNSRSPIRPIINPQPVYPQIQTPPQAPVQNLNQQSMSNIYSAYMARMLPFMYNPLQYAAAMANSQPTSSPTSQFLGMLNQGFQFNQGHQSRQMYVNKPEGTSVFNSILSSASSSSDEPTNSSGNYSYSGSSRSSSMSPSNKAANHMSISTSTDEGNQTANYKTLSPRAESSFSKVSSSAKKTLSIDQMLNTKVSKETQTETSCSSCPYCSGNNQQN